MAAPEKVAKLEKVWEVLEGTGADVDATRSALDRARVAAPEKPLGECKGSVQVGSRKRCRKCIVEARPSTSGNPTACAATSSTDSRVRVGSGSLPSPGRVGRHTLGDTRRSTSEETPIARGFCLQYSRGGWALLAVQATEGGGRKFFGQGGRREIGFRSAIAEGANQLRVWTQPTFTLRKKT